jgi:16S rRNA C967 or C1407 C5-methylase (RsmB/RsmF family)
MPNQVIERKPNGQFLKGQSGNIAGNAQRTRHLFSKAFVEALLEDFREWGAEAIVRVRTETPAAYLRVCATLIPRELNLERSQYVKSLSDEQIEQAIEAIQTMLAARAGEAAEVIEGTAEPAALPAPNGPSPEATLEATLEPTKRKPNRLMLEADTAVGPRERTLRKGKVPSPPAA